MSLGRGHRIAQEQGPIEIKFKDQARDFYTYMNIDGEYYKLRNPDLVTVELAWNCSETGKIRLLARKKE